MGKHDGQYYSKLFDGIELIHKENIVIMKVLFKLCGVDKEEIDKFIERCENSYKDIRKW